MGLQLLKLNLDMSKSKHNLGESIQEIYHALQLTSNLVLFNIHVHGPFVWGSTRGRPASYARDVKLFV